MLIMSLALAVFAMLALAAHGGVYIYPAVATPGPVDVYRGPLMGSASVIVDLAVLATPTPTPTPTPAPAPAPARRIIPGDGTMALYGYCLYGLRWEAGPRDLRADLFADDAGNVWFNDRLLWRQLTAEDLDPMRLAHRLAARYVYSLPYRPTLARALRLAHTLQKHGPAGAVGMGL